MPIAFEKCVQKGGKVRTVKLDSKRYRHICQRNGKSFLGYIKTRIKPSKQKVTKKSLPFGKAK